MLSLDFSKIRKSFPKRESVWHALQEWIIEHPQIEAVPVLDLIIDLQGLIETDDLLDAIDDLVSKGEARKVYRIVDPSMKVLLPEEYPSRLEVPKTIVNNWNEHIEVKPQDIAMVLESPK